MKQTKERMKEMTDLKKDKKKLVEEGEEVLTREGEEAEE